MRFAGDNSGVDFDPMSLRSAGSAGNYSAASGIVDVGNAFNSMRDKAPRFDQLSAEAMKNQAAENIAAQEAEAEVAGAGLSAFGQTKGQALQAEGAIESAKIKAAAQKQAATMGAIGGIVGAGLKLIPGLSDERTKTAIEPIDNALTKLRELKPVTFYYKPEYGDHTRQHHGFIAQEYQKVVPDATYQEDSTGLLCIDTTDLIGLLVRSVQQLELKIVALEAKAALEAV